MVRNSMLFSSYCLNCSSRIFIAMIFCYHNKGVIIYNFLLRVCYANFLHQNTHAHRTNK
ncbi:hypothetical protein CDL12_13150 [Handroanthus impetiginosus]|uniref:Uncharacterized protein n=1 Tax=Handroanthus impetiginosus TaxID=429701 RepID=A0A2G9H9L8_9LAMI|nr:hypothetical protein CDL12_13150 [Handroanthus impetiginosus]